MKSIITAVLCIALAGVGLAQNVFGALTYAQYTEKTREKFQTFAVAIMEHTDARLHQDVLDDPNEVDNTAWITALDALDSHYKAILIGYPTKNFWLVGADAVIQSALTYETARFDGYQAHSDDLLGIMEIGEHHFGIWIDNQSEPASTRILMLTSGTTSLIHWMKFYSESGDGNLSEAAASVLNGFVEKLDSHYDKDKRQILSQPFVKRLIKVLKYVRDNNDWPDEKALSKL